ncbi:MAG: hypothetical protein QOJ30_2531 [Pseudonocardiales bacterium]|nr:hypothetical protein [Pseudonocardiales bacterium]
MSVRYGDDVVAPGLPEDTEGGVDGYGAEEVEYEGPPFGPYDAEYLDPEMTDVARMDFGAVQVPVPMTGTVNLEQAAKGKLQAVHVTMPGGRLSVSALAAPRSSGLWSQLASEIEQSLRDGGAQVRSFQGEWGRELHARTDGARSVFVGVDGERWMLYGVATGPAEHAVALDDELRRMLRATVVVRGRQPYPPRTVLPLSTPESLDPASQRPTDARPKRATMTLRTKPAEPDMADAPAANETTAVSPVEGTGGRAAVNGRPQRRPALSPAAQQLRPGWQSQPARQSPPVQQSQGAQESRTAQQHRDVQRSGSPQQPRPGAGAPQPGPVQPARGQPGRGQRPAPVARPAEPRPDTSRPAAAQAPGQGQQRSGGFPTPAREESGFGANRSGWSSRGAEPRADGPDAGRPVTPEQPVERSAATRRAEQANIDTGLMPPVAGGRRRARQAGDTGSRARGSATGQHRTSGRSAARPQPARDQETTQQIGYDDWYGGGDLAAPVRRTEPPAPDETTRISSEPLAAERAPAPGRRARTEDVRGSRPASAQPESRQSRSVQAPAARNGAAVEGPATTRQRGGDAAPASPQAPAAYGQTTPGQGPYAPATHDRDDAGRDAYRSDRREVRPAAAPPNGRRPSRNDGPPSRQISPVAAEQPEPARPARQESAPREQPRPRQDGRWPAESGMPRTNGSARPARDPEQDLTAAFDADPLGAAAIPAERLAAVERAAAERAAARQSSPPREDARNGYAHQGEAGGRSAGSQPAEAAEDAVASNGYPAGPTSSGAYAAYGESPSGSYAPYDESYSARYGNPYGSAPGADPADPWAADPWAADPWADDSRGEAPALNGRASNGAGPNGAGRAGAGRRARAGTDHGEPGRRARNGVAPEEALDPMALIARIREQNGGGVGRSRGRHRAPGE